MFQDYLRHGWSLCAIERGRKSPTYDDWPVLPIDADIASVTPGAGLLHAISGTCALDIDDLSLARDWLAERGVDIDALLEDPKAVRIHSGRKGRAKLLYRLKRPLRTFKPKGSGIELRCATLGGDSVQDVLPPSIHPETKRPYEWMYGEPLLGDWRNLPPLPANILNVWRSLLDENPPPKPKANGHAAAPDVDLLKLQKWIDGKDPEMEYDDWLKVGMQLHDATGGSEEGLAIFDQWSSRTKRNSKNGKPAYQGMQICRIHWVSFSSAPGKVVATLEHELPADADEFEVVTQEEAQPSKAEAQAQQSLREQSKEAFKKLEARLVYVIASEKYFDTLRHKLIGSEAALEHLFTSMMPLRKAGRVNPVKVLKNSTTKRFVEGLGFHPGEGALFQVGDDTFANLYRNRLPKPIEPTKFEAQKIDWLFDRIDDENYRQWLKRYYAHVVQKPAIKLKSAPLIWSETQRNGKTTLLKAIPSLLVGAEFSTDVGYDLLASAFNDYLQGKWHVNLTEFRANARGERTMINNKLKAYIADDMIPFHPKGGSGYAMPNHFFVTATSNEEDAAAIDNNDERWGIHELKVAKFTQSERKWIYTDFLLQPRAAAVLRHFFLHVDLGDFDPAGSAPLTDAKEQMVNASMAGDSELLRTMFEERSEFFAKDVVLSSEVMSYVHRHSPMRPNSLRIGRILTRPPFNGTSHQYRVGEKRYRVVIFRNVTKWLTTAGAEAMNYVNGGDDDIDIMA